MPVKRIIIFTFIILLMPVYCLVAQANNSLSEKLKGKILLQVEENGEAWYVYPENNKRYFLGRPKDAFQVMKKLGLGIKHDELQGYLQTSFPSRLSGMIVLDVEQNGEAYYVYPQDLKGYYLNRPIDAFKIMREKGLGITNNDLMNISDSRILYENESFGVSFYLPELTEVRTWINTINWGDSGSQLLVYGNTDRMEFNQWFFSFFPENNNKDCIMGDSDKKIGNYAVIKVTKESPQVQCADHGYYAMNHDRSRVIRVPLSSIDDVVIETIRFIP